MGYKLWENPMNKSMMTLAAFGIAFAGMASAETWTLDGSASQMSFGSVKKDVIGEVHHFNGLSLFRHRFRLR